MAVLRRREMFASLILLDSGPAAIPTEKERTRLGMLTVALAEHSASAVWAAMQELARLEGREGPADPAVAAFLQRRFLANSPTGLAAKAAHLLTEPDRVEELAATGVPVLVAYGEDDEAWPPRVQAEMAQRLHASHAVVSRCRALAERRAARRDRHADGPLLGSARSRGLAWVERAAEEWMSVGRGAQRNT